MKIPSRTTIIIAVATLVIIAALVFSKMVGAQENPVECTIVCSDAYVTGDHTLSMDVTSTGREFTGPVVIFTQGPVTMDIGTCALEGDLKDSCTWSATGDPTYQGDQSVLVRFTQRDHYGEIMNEVECLMTGAGGLPVELLEFGVE